MSERTVVILGATGSIGGQTLDVCAASNGTLHPIGLSAHSKWRELFSQAREARPRWVTITDTGLRDQIDRSLLPRDIELLYGEDGVARMVTDPGTDVVVAGMVGAAGLRGAVAALQAGKRLALANKETLVVGGPLVMDIARRAGAAIVPVDSEHSAIHQCLLAGRGDEVARVILTGSGGPFRSRPLDTFGAITPEEALKHPTWTMGPKITIDSATMMNKALEIIEAHWLFDLRPDQIIVSLHPQSIIHSMVEYVDGSVIAHASPPDMRLPIQYALTYPDRRAGPARKLSFDAAMTWEFSPPDPRRYPALALGYRVIERGGTAGAALNAANEMAVERFLRGDLRFLEIVRLCQDILEHHPFDAAPSLEGLERVDQWARREAAAWR